MLPGIKEDESAVFISFEPKKPNKRLNSSCKRHIDVLNRKIKQLQSGPKVKIPDALKRHWKLKRKTQTNNYDEGFPCLQKMFEKIRSSSFSPDKKCIRVTCDPTFYKDRMQSNKTVFGKSKYSLIY